MACGYRSKLRRPVNHLDVIFFVCLFAIQLIIDDSVIVMMELMINFNIFETRDDYFIVEYNFNAQNIGKRIAQMCVHLYNKKN